MSQVERARRLLAGAGEVMVLTGAGISADSGVPTFRGEGGLWREHRPEELATPRAFARDPRLVWEWYAWRREVVSGCRPNEAHRALARWALRRDAVWIVTQNVDGLHAVAARVAGGSPTDRLIELHGSLFRVRCTGCGERRAHRRPIDATSEATLPRCEACGSLLRPDVVWFGEPLPESVISGAVEVARRADACLVVGTSAVVQPAAGLASTVAQRGGALIEVNPAVTSLTTLAHVSLRTRAAATVPALVASEDAR